MFNRKRAGEIERITIEDFETCNEISENELDYFSSSLNNPSTSSEKYVRFLIRGKKARGVPVLLTQLMSKAIKLVLQHRDEAGVSKKIPMHSGFPEIPQYIHI